MNRFTHAVMIVLCLCRGMALAQSEWGIPNSAESTRTSTLFPLSYTQMDEIRGNFGEPAKRTFALDFWPKLVELKGFYLENRQDGAAPMAPLNDPNNAKWGSYFDLLAVSSGFGGKLIGEGEFAYSTLGFAALPDQQPIMSRFQLRGSWGKTNYGLQYRSLGGGFVATTGLKVDHPRDERQLWGEYDFGLFKLRGNFAESWETHSQTKDLTLTRTTSTLLNFNRPRWSASLSSSYALSGQQTEQSEPPTPAFTNALSLAYRPSGCLIIEPGLSLKQEWDPVTGIKTDTPSAGLALICSPDRDLQFSSRASYSRALSEDASKEASTVSTAASLNWKIGKPFLGEQTLSFQLEYKKEISPNALTKPEPNLTGLLQWKIAGF